MPRSYFARHYILGLKIGEGNFASVYTAISRRTGKLYAVKIERLGAETPQLEHESEVYRRIHRNGTIPGILRPLYYGRDGNKKILLMHFLGPSISARRREMGGRLSITSICMIAVDILHALEALHGRGIIHGDVKPQNILSTRGGGKGLYLIDFGLSQRYKTSLGHIRNRSRRPFLGHLRYASVGKHYGYQESRRDDIESLGYCLLSLRTGSLPWESLKARNRQRLHERVVHMKETLPLSRLCAGLPSMIRYFLLQRDISFAGRPNYNALRMIFINQLLRIGCTAQSDLKFDWETSDDDHTAQLRRRNTAR